VFTAFTLFAASSVAQTITSSQTSPSPPSSPPSALPLYNQRRYEKGWSFLHDPAYRTEALDRSNYFRCSCGAREKPARACGPSSIPDAAVIDPLKREVDRRNLSLKLSWP